MILAAALSVTANLTAQDPQPKFKGIFEPIGFPADLELLDVDFATADVGWVTGAAGTILHTRDAGASWQAQLGGDAGATDPGIQFLTFVDETHAWAAQPAAFGTHKLLATSDGETWQPLSTLETDWGLVALSFTTATNGVYVNGNDNVARILHTSDGGRTWREAFDPSSCTASLLVGGLTRELECTIRSLHFPSAQVGYATGDFGYEAPRTMALLKTVDGGANWALLVVSEIGEVFDVSRRQQVFFTNEETGFVQLNGKSLHVTRDGGETWQGVVASPGLDLRFAGAEVGWSFAALSSYNSRLSYTVNGGARWSSSEIAFPAEVHAVSLPRGDRGYLVGDHGMIYRYRVVPADTPTGDGVLAGPVMPHGPDAGASGSQQGGAYPNR